MVRSLPNRACPSLCRASTKTGRHVPRGVGGRAKPGHKRLSASSSGCEHYRRESSEDEARTGRGPSAALTPQEAPWLELMQFYIREAWLLDEPKLKEWLNLFTDDVLYFMPRRKNVLHREAHRELTPLGDLAILEEDGRYLEMRVAPLDTGMAWAEDPRRAPVT